MRTKRLLSFLMMLVMLAGTVTPLLTFTAFAAEEEEEEVVIDYTVEPYETPEDKLATMGAPVYTNGDMEMYYHSYTGEVMIRNSKTGQLLSTNPSGVGNITAAGSRHSVISGKIVINFFSVRYYGGGTFSD